MPEIEGAGTKPVGLWHRFSWLLASPVDGASLAVFRIAVGAIMVLEAITLLRPSLSSGGAVPLETYYTGPGISFSFQYAGFEWLPLLPSSLIYAVVAALAIAGLTMALGLFYRISAGTVFLTWGYLYAVESTRTYWMSHYYLVLLVTFLMVWMPAARRYSLDALRARSSSNTVPFWTIFLLRGQLLITYFYAGVAKLNADWLLDAEPVRYYLSQPHVATPVEFMNRILRRIEFAYFVSYAGAIFDLTIGFLLVIRRTRMLGLALMLLFHATNHFVIFEDIGWFPLLGVATALIFLDPDWPERLRAWFGSSRRVEPARRGATPRIEIGRSVPHFVWVWLVWQALFPLRHLVIPGDARVTFEGLSFSWRLKAEVYRSTPCAIRIRDPGVFPTTDAGPPTINWGAWEGDKVIYRQTAADELNWAELPELVIVFEPYIGERILYNPYANSGRGTGRTSTESIERAQQLWQELYGRKPGSIQPTVPLATIVDAFAQAWIKRGGAPMDPAATLNQILNRHGQTGDGKMIPMLRRVYPFELAGRPPGASPFLVIEDPGLISQSPTEGIRVNRTAWKHGLATQPSGGPRYTHPGGDPLILYTVELNLRTKDLFPTLSIFDSQSHPDQPPFVAWDYLDDVNVSKAMHLGMQPFLLRRYARRVADLWQSKHGRRPSIYASTALSLNGRPFQPVVDPEVDLAAVPVRWFGHNGWIRDLEEARIPQDRALQGFLGNPAR